MEHLFQAWSRVSPKLKAARKVLLFSDFDGTLTPIVERPEDAVLSPEVKRLLQALAHRPRFTVGIISGRALKDLEERVDVPGIIYAGNHGLEIKGPGMSFVSPLVEEMKSTIRLIHSVLSRTLGDIKGVQVEDKGLSLSVHYRLVPEVDLERVYQGFQRVIRTAQMLGKVRVTSGKKVLEVRPPLDWNKGKAIEYIMRRYHYDSYRGPALALYLGDDLTDEDGFMAMEKLGGISILVGEEDPHSAAHYCVRSPQEVAEFLQRVLEVS